MHLQQGTVTPEVEVRQAKSPQYPLGGPRYEDDHLLVIAAIGVRVGTEIGQYLKFGVGAGRCFVVRVMGPVETIAPILLADPAVVLAGPGTAGPILRGGRVDPEVAVTLFALDLDVGGIGLLEEQREGFPLADDDPICSAGIGGAVGLGIHCRGGHDEVVPLQRGQHRTVVEDAFLFAYLLRIYEAGHALLILDHLRDDVLGAVLIGIGRIGQ